MSSQDALESVLASLAAESSATRKASARATAARKPPETLEDGFGRVMATKLTDAERNIVQDVQSLLRTGALRRVDNAAKLSKREVFELAEQHRIIVRDDKRQRVIDTRPDNVWVVTDVVMLNRVREMISDNDVIAVDTETSGLDLFVDRMCGWSAYFPKQDIAVYVSFRHTGGKLYDGERDWRKFYEWYDDNRIRAQVPVQPALDVLREIVCDASKRTVFHNGKYDLHIIANDGIIVNNFWWDTMSAAKLLNENEESHSLKALYVKYVMGGEEEKITFSDLFDDQTIYDKDILLSGIYAAKDASMTYKLFDFQKPHIDTRDNLKTIWYVVEQRLLPVDWRLERTGFRLNVEHFERLKTTLEQKVSEAEQTLLRSFDISGEVIIGGYTGVFNVNSTHHLSWLIYDKLGIDPAYPKRFNKAERSTARDVIDALCNDTPDLKPLLEYRKSVKMLQFADKLPKAIDPTTGRIHCRFNNMTGDDFGSSGAATGRYSSSEYCSARHSRTGGDARGFNSQQLPSKGGIREGFVPDDGWVFIGADESQIEPRVIAHILYTQYGDDSMKRLYDDGADLYTTMAMQAFGLDREYCVDKAMDPTGSFYPRKTMKTGLLAALYGQSPRSFARVVGVSEDVALTFFAGLDTSFPGLKRFREDTISRLRSNTGNIAYSETEYGHKRRYPDYRKNYAELQRLEKLTWKQRKSDPELDARRSWLWKYCAAVEREAVNHRIQGTAAAIIKLVMIEIDDWCVRNGYKFHLTAHDEVKVSVPLAKLTPDVVTEVDRIMTQTVQLSVPLKSDCVIERWWMDETSPDDWDYERGCPKTTAA